MLAHLAKKEITVLIGARQVGKSTLMMKMVEEFKNKNVPTLYLNLDIEKDEKYLESQTSLLAKIKLEFGEEYGILFIDEIQRKENAGRFLKGVYDTMPNFKIVISGSGSLELKEKITESLAGRKRVFEISPVSFWEFVDFSTAYKYSGNLDSFLVIEKDDAEKFLKEYLLFGGYPNVITSVTAEEKKTVISEIFTSYLNRDIRALLNIHHVSAYSKLIDILSQQTSYPVKYSSLSQYVTISANTVKDYIWYMEHTYIIRKSLPFYTNPLKEIVKEPTVYFVDLGMLNYKRNNLFADYNTPSFGFIFQNFIFNLLYDEFNSEGIQLKYWRTKDQAEVDIIIDIPGNPIPVEIKYGDLAVKRISRSMRSFIRKYQPKLAVYIGKNTHAEYQIDNTLVISIPYGDCRGLYSILQEKL